MEQLLSPQLFMQFGLAGMIAFLAIKALTKLYNDMREDSKTREDKLMEHLDKVTDTLDSVKLTLKDFNTRLIKIEECVKRRKEEA